MIKSIVAVVLVVAALLLLSGCEEEESGYDRAARRQIEFCQQCTKVCSQTRVKLCKPVDTWCECHQ